MTFGLGEHLVQAIVLDIEGTTTPIAFVYDVLFPFARAHLGEHLRQHLDTDELREALRRLRAEWVEDVAQAESPPDWSLSRVRLKPDTTVDSAHGSPDDRLTVRLKPDTTVDSAHDSPDDRLTAQIESVTAYVEWLMDRDRKSPGLKLLQGQIWERGYRAGLLKGEVFPDVPTALQRWRDARIEVAIYSSGSVLAQRLIFSSTPYGDLTAFISQFFDTASGAKTSPDSYRRIAGDLACPAERMLFISDVTKELDAARSVGCQVLLCVRPANPPQTDGGFSVIRSLDEIA